MSIIKKLSNVLKEVFWIKTSSKRKSAVLRKGSVRKTAKKTVKKARQVSKPVKAPKTSAVKVLKKEKPLKLSKAIKAAKSPKVKILQIDSNLVKVGEITHYFERISVCVVKINQGTILIGDKLTFAGKKSKFVQKVWSMQIESQDVKVAKKGQLIGLKVDKPVAVGDLVYK